jgi:hypothetical protein
LENIDMATPQKTSSYHPGVTPPEDAGPSATVVLLLAWLAVGVPLLWGVVTTLKKALALFA